MLPNVNKCKNSLYIIRRWKVASVKTRQDNKRSRTQALQCLEVRISNVGTQINNIQFIQLKTLIDLQFWLGSLSVQT